MAIELFDTHCHVHEIEEHLTPVHDKWFSDNAPRSADSVLADARADGVSRMLVIGTSLADSELAVKFAQSHEHIWASIGIHPHEAKLHTDTATQRRFAELAAEEKVIAVGECGLDYYYEHSPKDAQQQLLRFQLELAAKHALPLSFHVRDAFDDFWPIFDEFDGVRGVLHSYTDNETNLQRAVEAGLYIGVNGIATFPSSAAKHVIYRTIPQRSLLLETDAPFLTPVPFRGKVCEPKHVRVTAEYVAGLRSESLEEIARYSTANARELFQV